jgi:Protein of unknown function (DUF2778)
MPWQYSQSTGRLTHDGRDVGGGYSGHGDDGQNNPTMEAVRNVGPIPRGSYRIGPQHSHPSKGPVVMGLAPVGHTAHGRTGFLIHGDSVRAPGTASEGCIVLRRNIRQMIADSGDAVLEVVR